MPLVLAQRSAARLVLAAAAVGAGLIHLVSVPAHIEEYLPLGIGFLAVGGFQVLWGAHVALRDSPRWLLVGGALSFAFVGIYLLSRTTGLPLGPAAFQPEAFGIADLLCCAIEVPGGFAAIALGRRPRALRARVGARWAMGSLAALVVVGSASGTALAAGPAHDHGDDHPHESPAGHEGGTGDDHACPSAPVRTGVLDERGVDTGVTAYFRCLLEHQHDASGHPAAGDHA